VIQRVKKMPGVGPPGGRPEYTRTWSMAIRIITAPRIRSIEVTRETEAALVGTGWYWSVELIEARYYGARLRP
jgi:hypothetical protein